MDIIRESTRKGQIHKVKGRAFSRNLYKGRPPVWSTGWLLVLNVIFSGAFDVYVLLMKLNQESFDKYNATPDVKDIHIVMSREMLLPTLTMMN
jgi:hypothetical protein